MERKNNLQDSNLDQDTLDLLTTTFELYNIAKLNRNVYHKDNKLSIAKKLITSYYKLINPNYNNMFLSFKRKYICNEALVEKNDTLEERKGLELVYDYIQSFDIDKDYFNIFFNAMKIHSLLFKPLDDKNNADFHSKQEYAIKLKEEAMKEKNLNKLKEARNILSTSSNSLFGGKLRDVSVILNEFSIEIPEPDEMKRKFNAFLSQDKIFEYQEMLNNTDIIEYINYVVDTTADLIALQPFCDGNKRTFRSLLNLMFKKKNLPPVYITGKERKVYHDALEKAVCEKDYTELEIFYYYKICDSIYELKFESDVKDTKQKRRNISVKNK